MVHIKNIISNFYLNINAPIYMREVEKYSSNDFSLLMLVLFYLPFILLVYFFYKYKFKKQFYKSNIIGQRKKSGKTFATYFIYLTYFVILILLIHILISPTPLFNADINKSNFWYDYALFPQIRIISSQLSFLLFILGSLYARQKFKKNEYYFPNSIFIFSLVLSVLYYILMKQKFGGPLLMIFHFYAPYFILGFYYRKLNTKKIISIGITIMSILSITVIGYFYMRFGLDAGKLIFERIFKLQSQMWEVTCNYFGNGLLPFEKNELMNQIEKFFGLKDGYFGMHYVMSKVMELDNFNLYMTNKINLSSAYPAYYFYIFNKPLLMLPMIFGIHIILYSLLVFFGFKTIQKLLSKNIIIAALYMKLVFAFHQLTGQVYLGEVIAFDTVLYLLLILLIENNFFRIVSKNKYK